MKNVKKHGKNSKRQVVAGIIAIVLVLAMVVPLIIGALS